MTCWPFTNYFGHLGRTSMAVKSVGVRSAPTCLVVKFVHWASSRTVMAVSSASAEVRANASPPLTTTCFQSGWKPRWRKSNTAQNIYKLKYGNWEEPVQHSLKECVVLLVFVIIYSSWLQLKASALLSPPTTKSQKVIVNKIWIRLLISNYY